MKRFLIVLLTLVISMQAAVCLAEEAVVEYDSLEEINALIGVNIMRPAVMGVTNERFSIVNDVIAQYECEVNGIVWTFRGAYITDEDISGINDERNEFIPGEDYGVYANEFYMERFFDGDRQYTIVVKDPISADGDVYLDSMVFDDACMEIKSILEQHLDDPLVGDYEDTVSQRASACVERFGDVYNVSVNWSDSGFEFYCWTMYDAVLEDGRLDYQGEEIGHYVYDEEGNEVSSEVNATNNAGWFEIKDGLLYWTGASDENCRTCVFEKIVYDE